MPACMLMVRVYMLLNHGTSQTTTSTASVEPIWTMMNSMIKSNMQSMQQPLQSPTTTMPSKNALQSSSASIEFQTPKMKIMVTMKAVVMMNKSNE